MLKRSLGVAVLMMMLTPSPTAAVYCLSCPMLNSWINEPFYWLDCQLGGYLWGQC